VRATPLAIAEHTRDSQRPVELGDLSQPWRSVAMCNSEMPMLSNAEVDRLLHALIDALDELRRLRRWCGLD
jgi:hypothetical protein